MNIDVIDEKYGLRLKMTPRSKKDRLAIMILMSYIGDCLHDPPSRVISFLSQWPDPKNYNKIGEVNFKIGENPFNTPRKKS